MTFSGHCIHWLKATLTMPLTQLPIEPISSQHPACDLYPTADDPFPFHRTQIYQIGKVDFNYAVLDPVHVGSCLMH